MSIFNLSANMSLPIPVQGLDPGPDYALNINNCLTLLDGHDHSAGKGVAITPAGLNINADLPLNNNNLTLVKTARFTPQVSLPATSPNLACLFVIGADLYYNDAAGNQVRITQGGAVTGASGTITGLPSGTAGASYNSLGGEFIFQSASNIAADLDGGSILIREKVAGANRVKISSPAALAANYDLILPSVVPPSRKIMSLDNAGNIASEIDVDNSSIEIDANLFRVKDLGITLAKLAALVTERLVPAGSILAYLSFPNLPVDAIRSIPPTRFPLHVQSPPAAKGQLPSRF